MRDSRTFRIFVSSTFSDLKQERDALQQHVFPKLQELCLSFGWRFQAIDLRWGISEEAALDQQTMNICLTELKRCQMVTPRPNFIILLGDRYGWIPLPAQIEASEFKEILSRANKQDQEVLKWDETLPDGGGGWYRLDTYAVPPEYVLRPRREEVFKEADYTCWGKTEERLRAILLAAINSLGWPVDDTRRIKYECSATHQEISEGALKLPDEREHVFAFLRNIRNIEDLPPGSAYTDAGVEKARALKKTIKETKGVTSYSYDVTWSGRALDTHLNQFAADALASLRRIIEEEIGQLKQIDDLTRENIAHEEFGAERCRHFVGRQKILDAIAAYIGGDDASPLVIYGPSGSGKSAVIAQVVAEARSKYKESEIVVRFVGATPGSSDGRSLLENLCREITRRYKGDESEIPAEYRDLVQEFRKRLDLARRERQLIIFLDAPDQLAGEDRAADLTWLPTRLPLNVKLIVSSTATLDRICSVELTSLSKRWARKVLNSWLRNSGRRLTKSQKQTLLEEFSNCPLPLYLKLAFEEAKLWKSYDSPKEIGADIEGIVSTLFGRLSKVENHGRVLVAYSMGYLLSARHGITEDEMVELLWRDKDVREEFFLRSPKSPHLTHEHEEGDEEITALPIAVWSRLFMDLEPYLTSRRGDNTTLLGFYHHEMQSILRDQLAATEAVYFHNQLAAYFDKQPPWQSGSGPLIPNYRKTSEEVHQLIQGNRRDYAEGVIADANFTAAKCTARKAFEIIEECEIVNPLQSSIILEVRKILSSNLVSLTQRPEYSVQTMYNEIRSTSTDSLATWLPIFEKLLDRFHCWISIEMPYKIGEPGYHEIVFEKQALGQFIDWNRRTISVTDASGQVATYSLDTGKRCDLRVLPERLVRNLAWCSDVGKFIYQDNGGMIRLETGESIFHGRKGDSNIVYSPACGLLAVRSDGTLVAWHPLRRVFIEIVPNLKEPLTFLKASRDGKYVLFCSGNSQQIIGLANITPGPPVVSYLAFTAPARDGDINDKVVLLALADRRLSVYGVGDAQLKNETAYENWKEARLKGSPVRCALGTEAEANVAYLVTDASHVGRWQFDKDQSARLTEITEFPVVNFTCDPQSSRVVYSTNDVTRFISPVVTRRSTLPTGITHCAFVGPSSVAGWSSSDKLLYWIDVKNYRVHGPFTFSGLTCMSAMNETMLLGDQSGHIWRLSVGNEPQRQSKLSVSNQAIIATGANEHGDIFVAEKNGGVQYIANNASQASVIRYGNLYQIQKHIFFAERRQFLWRIYEDILGDTQTTVSSVKMDGTETVLYQHKGARDIIVAGDGETFCIIDSGVTVMRENSGRFHNLSNRLNAVDQVSFVGNGSLVAVVVANTPWVEIWDVKTGLETIGAIRLPSPPICLANYADMLAIGFANRPLLILKLHLNKLPKG